jgi:hypothetical protein
MADRNLKQAALKLHDRRWGSKIDAPPRGSKRIPSLAEQLAEWRPEGYHKLFCAHDVPRWKPCSKKGCERDAKEAEGFAAELLNATHSNS